MILKNRYLPSPRVKVGQHFVGNHPVVGLNNPYSGVFKSDNIGLRQVVLRVLSESRSSHQCIKFPIDKLQLISNAAVINELSLKKQRIFVLNLTYLDCVVKRLRTIRKANCLLKKTELSLVLLIRYGAKYWRNSLGPGI